MGAFWGASYYVMLQQQQIYSEWIVIQHEALCQNPIEHYRELLNKLNLHWTTETDELLNNSTTKESNDPYLPQRISIKEHSKWDKRLDPKQIKQVLQSVEPFRIPYY